MMILGWLVKPGSHWLLVWLDDLRVNRVGGQSAEIAKTSGTWIGTRCWSRSALAEKIHFTRPRREMKTNLITKDLIDFGIRQIFTRPICEQHKLAQEFSAYGVPVGKLQHLGWTPSPSICDFLLFLSARDKQDSSWFLDIVNLVSNDITLPIFVVSKWTQSRHPQCDSVSMSLSLDI